MSVATVKQQLFRELQKSWQKTALLAVLFGVGLFFWIPPLLRALGSGHSGGGAIASSAAASEMARNGLERPPVTADAAPAQAAAPANSWEQMSAALEADPLVRSVEVAAIQSDPFRIDFDQFAPPVLFEDESHDPAEASPRSGKPLVRNATGDDAETGTPKAPPGLVLKSTIVGVHRRAALINSKLYYEGKEVYVDGEVYRLTTVLPRKVVLSRGPDLFELEIARPAGAKPASLP